MKRKKGVKLQTQVKTLITVQTVFLSASFICLEFGKHMNCKGRLLHKRNASYRKFNFIALDLEKVSRNF